MTNKSNPHNGFWDGFYHILGIGENPTRQEVKDIIEKDSVMKIKEDFGKITQDYKKSLNHLKRDLAIEF